MNHVDFSSFSALQVAGICMTFLVVYTVFMFKIGQVCEKSLNATHWRLIAYVPSVILFFAGFIIALFLFSSQKVVVIELFFSYNLIKIIFGVLQSIRFTSKTP